VAELPLHWKADPEMVPVEVGTPVTVTELVKVLVPPGPVTVSVRVFIPVVDQVTL
jgi:hypothetical protein